MLNKFEVWRDGFKIMEFLNRQEADDWIEHTRTNYNKDSSFEVKEVELPLLYVPYNPHPQQKHVGDCVKRAFTRLMGEDYKTVSLLLNRHKKVTNSKTFNQDKNWRSFAESLGWSRETLKVVKGIPKTRVWEFVRANPQGKFLIKASRHVIAVEDGIIFDSFDSRNGIVHHYWRVV